MLDVAVHDLRDFTDDRHRVVDDVPFGGGPGMVLKPEPLFGAVDAHPGRRAASRGAVRADLAAGAAVHAGRRRRGCASWGTWRCCAGATRAWTSGCVEHLATEEISIGDYVLSGGELAALVIVDAVARLVPGVVGDEDSVGGDSFSRGLLDYPHYTRPAEFAGWKVPDVLLSGHHAEIEPVAAAGGAAPHAATAAGPAGWRDARRRRARVLRELLKRRRSGS